MENTSTSDLFKREILMILYHGLETLRLLVSLELSH